MRYIVQLLICLLLIGCGDDPTVLKTELSADAKQIVPYTLNEVVKWKDQKGEVYTGKVTLIKTNRYVLSSPNEVFDNEEIETNIDFGTFRFVVKQRSTDDINEINYSVEYVVNDKIIHVFDLYEMPINAFRDFIYKDVNYYNSVVLRSSGYYNSYPILLVFSKHAGIVYVQFGEDHWFREI